MSDSHSPRLAAALRLTTRTTAFRAGLAILMLIALLPTRTSGQFPNCDCNTLWELCNSGQNNQSCGVWEANCMVSGYCDCMAQFDNNEAWCAQFCGSTFCACVSCVSNVTIEGGGSTAGGSVSLTAHAYGQDGQDHSSEGSWSWTLDNDSIGRLEAGGNGATFYPNGNPGSGWITATFFQSSCDPMSGSGEVSVTRTCPTVSLSLNGPDAVETNGTESYSISGYPGSLPEGTSCDQDNPNAGSVQYSDGACVFTASSAAGDETTITVTVHPPDGCPQSSAQKRVTVAGDCAPWRQNGPGTSPDATIDTRALVPSWPGREHSLRRTGMERRGPGEAVRSDRSKLKLTLGRQSVRVG